jgi:hypothetical protein
MLTSSPSRRLGFSRVSLEDLSYSWYEKLASLHSISLRVIHVGQLPTASCLPSFSDTPIKNDSDIALLKVMMLLIILLQHTFHARGVFDCLIPLFVTIEYRPPHVSLLRDAPQGLTSRVY